MNTINENAITNISGYEHVFEDSDSKKIALIREKACSLALSGQDLNLRQLINNIPIIDWLKIYKLSFPFITNHRNDCATALVSSLESNNTHWHTYELKAMLSELEALYASDIAYEPEAEVIRIISDKIYHITNDKRYKLLRDYCGIYSCRNLEQLEKWLQELIDHIDKINTKPDCRNIAYLIAIATQRMAINQYGKGSVITEDKIRSLLYRNDYYNDNLYDDEFDIGYDDYFGCIDDFPSVYIPSFCKYIHDYNCPEILRVFAESPYWFDSEFLFQLYQAVQRYNMRFKYINDTTPIFKTKLSFCHYGGLNRFNTCFDDDVPQDKFVIS